MASEYLIQKAKREAAPPPPPREYTRREKIANWFYYNKIWLCVGAILLWIVGSMVWNILGIGQVKPDVVLAYIGNREISDTDAEQLEQALTSLGADLNGDGDVVFSLRRYRLNHGGDPATAYYYNYASDTSLIADITIGESVFFLTEDPEGIQRSYQIFANSDGTPPGDQDYTVADKVFLWVDCPALSRLGLGDSLVSGLYIGRRGFFEKKQAERHDGCDIIWEAMVQGAVR